MVAPHRWPLCASERDSSKHSSWNQSYIPMQDVVSIPTELLRAWSIGQWVMDACLDDLWRGVKEQIQSASYPLSIFPPTPFLAY